MCRYLHHILAGVGVRRGKICHHRLVQHSRLTLTLGAPFMTRHHRVMGGIHIQQLAEARVSRGQRMAQTQKRRNHLLRAWPREAHHTDPAAAHGRRDRYNCLLLHPIHHSRIVARRAPYSAMARAPSEARLLYISAAMPVAS